MRNFVVHPTQIYNGNEKSHYIHDCCRMRWRPCEIIQNIKWGGFSSDHSWEEPPPAPSTGGEFPAPSHAVGAPSGKIICFTYVVGGPSEKIISFTYDVGGASEKIISFTYDVGGTSEKIISFTYDVGAPFGKNNLLHHKSTSLRVYKLVFSRRLVDL
jgi:hypothetical protein